MTAFANFQSDVHADAYTLRTEHVTASSCESVVTQGGYSFVGTPKVYEGGYPGVGRPRYGHAHTFERMKRD